MNTENFMSQHHIAEFDGCPFELINDEVYVKISMESAAIEANATILNSYIHKFSPQGVSGVLVLAESHLSIHTWPELNYAAIDIFTCGEHTDPLMALYFLQLRLKPTKFHSYKIDRGPKY